MAWTQDSVLTTGQRLHEDVLEMCRHCCALVALDGHATDCPLDPRNGAPPSRVDVLETLIASDEPLTARDVADRLGTPRAAYVNVLLGRLERSGHAVSDRRRYRRRWSAAKAVHTTCGECGTVYLCRCHPDCAARAAAADRVFALEILDEEPE